MKVKIERAKVKMKAKAKTTRLRAGQGLARGRTRAASSKARARKPKARPRPKLTFNHAMIYAADVPRSLAFYERLGFVTLETALPFYARLATGGGSTLALHQVEPGHSVAADGVRLYFETPRLAAVCRDLQAGGVVFTKPPGVQPWGWEHAYLDDPDGHEISLYHAGRRRLARARPNSRS